MTDRERPRAQPDHTILDPNTTFDIVVSPTGVVTEISDTVDAMDGAEVQVIDIKNAVDGTHIEVTLIEEASGKPGIDSVDRFVQIDGIGQPTADLLAKAGIRRFSQLAETPAERIIDILSAGGKRYRIHDATHWQTEARRLARQSTSTDAPATTRQ